jgi:hypothetical protein
MHPLQRLSGIQEGWKVSLEVCYKSWLDEIRNIFNIGKQTEQVGWNTGPVIEVSSFFF